MLGQGLHELLVDNDGKSGHHAFAIPNMNKLGRQTGLKLLIRIKVTTLQLDVKTATSWTLAAYTTGWSGRCLHAV